MKKYLIYTVNDTEPFVIETKEDLINEFRLALDRNVQILRIKHTKSLMTGTFKYDVVLNVNNIVSITTSEKV